MIRVVTTDADISIYVEGELRQSVRWSEIVEVRISIPDDEPFPEPWWIVQGASGRCLAPSTADGCAALRDEIFRRLVGIDFDAVAEAATMLSGEVVVWRQTASPAIH